MNLSVCIPDATINYITNPALRYDTTGWNVQGSTISRVLDHARFNIASLKVLTNGAALNEGAFFRVSALSGVSEPIAVSAYVRGAGTVRIRLDNNVVGGTEFASQPVALDDTRWQRISVTGFSTGGNDLRLFVETAEGTAKARTFYVDGAQLERKAYLTTYCDGDQAGCRWQGIYHASASERSAYTRAGGKWLQLAGPDREAEDLYVTVMGGLGVAPMVNNTQDFALAPGGFQQNHKVKNRVITMTFFAKHFIPDQAEQPVSLDKLHQLRQALIDAVKPDLTGGDEDILFSYQDGVRLVYFRARYDGGLEGEWDIRNQFVNSFPLRLLAVSPMMQEDSQEAKVLDFQDTLTSIQRIAARINGVWSQMNYGTSDWVTDFAMSPKGQLYVKGKFATVNANAAAVDPNRASAGIALWDGVKFNALGSGENALSAQFSGVAVAPNGDVYVTGNFTAISGVAANRVAKWNGTAWSALGTGLNAQGYCVAIAGNGDVYLGGEFTTAGGVACSYIARWDGVQWRRVGQFGGMNNFVRSISITPDGTLLYIGGDFTDQNGFATNAMLRVAKYTISTGLFSAMASGFNNIVYKVLVRKNLDVVAGGAFTASGSTTINYIAIWNGTNWSQLGAGVDGPTVYALAEMDNGNLVIAGQFTQSAGKSIPSLALWNGSTLTNFDIALRQSENVYAVFIPPGTMDIYIGGSLLNPYNVAGITIFQNPGSAVAYPVIYIVGPGRLHWIENQTTQKRIYLDLNILSNEEILIDIGKGTLKSTGRGGLFSSLLPGSDFKNFILIPGENKVAVFMDYDVSAQMSIQFTPQHWGVDATGS